MLSYQQLSRYLYTPRGVAKSVYRLTSHCGCIAVVKNVHYAIHLIIAPSKLDVKKQRPKGCLAGTQHEKFESLTQVHEIANSPVDEGTLLMYK
jgi:hypothetical protein